MKKTKLYISPHLDDAVFSCSARIINDIKKGNEVFVVTIFSSASEQEESQYLKRKREDQRALNVLGAKIIWLDYMDAPYRSNFYSSYTRITLGHDKIDGPSYLSKIKKSLEKIIHENNIDEIIAPLGIGTHIDHRIAFDIAQRLSVERKKFYEDKPYAFAKFALNLRLKQLGVAANCDGDISQENLELYFKSLSGLHYVKNYLNDSDEKDFLRKELSKIALKDNPGILIAKSEYSRINLSEFNKFIKAAGKYESQVADFFESVEEFKQQAKEYSNTISDHECYSERYWTIKQCVQR